ncbi:helix-turn-helix DNA binding domain protein [Bacillus phage Chotacabras]|nr:helix-turn-helix DNA binding domain protein [Bacillus phage Chotacabras]
MIDLKNDLVEDKLVVVQEKVKAPKGSKNPLTKEQEQGVARMYLRGEKVADIIDKYKIAAGRIYRIIARNGIEKRNPEYNREGKARANALSKYEKDRIVDDYIRKVTIREIEQKYGLNRYGVYMVLDERKITRQTELDEETTTVTPKKVHKKAKEKLPVEAYIEDSIAYVKIAQGTNKIEQIRIDYI